MVSRGLAKSREQANSMLMAGTVFVNQKRIDKPGQQITKESEIDVKGNTAAAATVASHSGVMIGGITRGGIMDGDVSRSQMSE